MIVVRNAVITFIVASVGAFGALALGVPKDVISGLFVAGIVYFATTGLLPKEVVTKERVDREARRDRKQRRAA